MRRVAGSAVQIAIRHRMSRELGEIRSYGLMAGIANRRLLCLHQHRIFGHMDGMAADASQPLTLVDAALPADPVAVLMAAQANRVIFSHRGRRMFAESGYGNTRLTGMQMGGMVTAGTVAGFALQLCKRRMRIGADRVLGLEYGECLGIVVAADAGIGATRCIGDGRRLGGRLRRIRRLTTDIK